MSRQLSQLLEDYRSAVDLTGVWDQIDLISEPFTKLDQMAKEKIPRLPYDTDHPAQTNTQHLEAVMRTTDHASPGKRWIAVWKALFQCSLSITAAVLTLKMVHMSMEEDENARSFLVANAAMKVEPSLNKVVDVILYNIILPSADALGKVEAVFDKIQLASSDVMAKMPHQVRVSVERLDQEFLQMLERVKGGSKVTSDSLAMLYRMLYIRQGMWLGQPRRYQNYHETYDPEAFAAFSAALTDPARFFARLVRNYLMIASLIGPHQDHRPQFMVHGSSARAAEQFINGLARTIQAPEIRILHTVILKDLRQGRTFVPESTADRALRQQSNVDVQGPVIDGLRNTGTRNAIVVFNCLTTQYASEGGFLDRLLYQFFNTKQNHEAENHGLENAAHAPMFVSDAEESVVGVYGFSKRLKELFMHVDVPDVTEEQLRAAFGQTADERAAEQVGAVSSADPAAAAQEQAAAGGLQDARNPPVQRRETDLDLLEAAMQKAVEAVGAVVDYVMESSGSAGATRTQHATRLALYHVCAEKLLAGDPDHAVDDEEIRKALNLGLHQRVDGPGAELSSADSEKEKED
ncbi:hypothetical protein AYO21_11515 [Fonsecaea monophora]|uniref:Uncharacterized protein n=1 Tax=Fonsecaea monophora TaxID=254056 RepID=A0A177EQP3_9EURO|nr:hypothetical protein AYO21_11515 [Fonsecaea monophora]KAH0829998.1 hypothetical protein FOPE_10302 [Fonsecaea pedrosoi]OAG34335.1 hypothetical protein AYO21_11515 [Fonsecaea monophora]